MKIIRLLSAVLALIAIAVAVFYRYPLWVNDEITRFHLWRAGVRSAYAEVGGYRIHYFEAKPADGSQGIPLLLVHGLGANGEEWARMIPALAANGFHVYVPDLLGYGRSSQPDVAYSVPLEEGVMVDFMHAVHLERADVGGWSMGGWISALLALDHPELVDRLVLYDSAGMLYQPSFPRDAFVPTTPATLQRLLNLLSPHPPQLPGFAVSASLRRIHAMGWVIQRNMDSMESGTYLLDKRLGGLTQPTLVIWGTLDQVIPLAVGQTMHQDIPGSAFLGIQGCGHLAPRECPRPVIAGTTAFLKANPAPHGGENLVPGD